MTPILYYVLIPQDAGCQRHLLVISRRDGSSRHDRMRYRRTKSKTLNGYEDGLRTFRNQQPDPANATSQPIVKSTVRHYYQSCLKGMKCRLDLPMLRPGGTIHPAPRHDSFRQKAMRRVKGSMAGSTSDHSISSSWSADTASAIIIIMTAEPASATQDT